MSSLQSKHSSQHHQAAFDSLKINLKYCKFQINFNCVQMDRKSVSSEIKWQVIGMGRTKNHTNVQIGKIFHVSEYCVRKTIKPRNLPRTSPTCRVLGDHPNSATVTKVVYSE